MPFSDEQFKKQMIDGQKTLSKLMGDMTGEISTLKNNSAAFEQEIRGYLESNPRTHQKGLVETVSGNTEDIKVLKTEVKTLGEKIADVCRDVKGILSDVMKIKTDWKVLIGKTSVSLTIFAAVGGVIWKVLSFLKLI